MLTPLTSNIQMPFPYKTETHLHTIEGSACGEITGEEQAIQRKKDGYDTIIVTDHFYRGNTAPSRTLPWEDYIEQFCKGYENAKRVGDEIGLNVLFGFEDAFHGAEFLIYGITKEWLLKHPKMIHWSPKEEYEQIHHAGGYVVQAHPFRERGYLEGIALYPKYIDAVEMINTAQPKAQNDRAEWFAAEYHFPVTAGSDTHSADGYTRSGILSPTKIVTIEDYISLIRGNSTYQLLDGARILTVHSASCNNES